MLWTPFGINNARCRSGFGKVHSPEASGASEWHFPGFDSPCPKARCRTAHQLSVTSWLCLLNKNISGWGTWKLLVIFLFHFETRSVIQADLDLCGQSSCLSLQNAVVTGVSSQAQRFRVPLTCYFSSILSLFTLINRLFIINTHKKSFSINPNLLPNLTNHECPTFPNFDHFMTQIHSTCSTEKPSRNQLWQHLFLTHLTSLKLLLYWLSLQTMVPSHVKAWHPI